MGSRSTNNSLQTAPVFSMADGESDLSPLTSHTVTSLADLPTTSQAVVAGSEGGISPALASFIAQTVQAALAAERSAHGSPPVSTTPTQSTAVEVPHSSVSVLGAFRHRWAAPLPISWPQELDFRNKVDLFFL